MAKVKPGRAYELWLAERARLEKALGEAAAELDAARWRELDARRALDALVAFESDPVAWANGETPERSTGIMHGFIRFSCDRCGASGSSKDGKCITCDAEKGYSKLNIYQTM